MNRFLIAIATAVFAMSAMFAPSAQAGFKGGRFAVGLAIGALMLSQQHHYEHEHWKKKRHYVRRKAEKKVYATKKSSSTKEVAKADPEPKVETADTVIENENSSISTAALAPIAETAADDTAAPPEPVKVVAEVPEPRSDDGPKTAKKLDCKKFFPSVGMTLSVSCE